jgi:hypothetical protein
MTPTLRIHEAVAIEHLLAAAAEEPATIRRLTAAELSNAEAAIARCTKAATEAKRAAEASGLTAKESRYRAIMAFKVSMPRMDTIDGCIECVACAVNGMLAGFLDGAEVSKLLYAAQIAQSLLRSAK